MCIRDRYGRLLAVVCDTDKERNKAIIPSIFDLSSGESALLTLFGEIIRQWDNLSRNRAMLYMTGIVLIDEVDKHLHITLQKEILPKSVSYTHLDVYKRQAFRLCACLKVRYTGSW